MGGWTTPPPGPFYPRESDALSRLGGLQGRYGEIRNIPPSTGIDPRSVQPAASRNTDYTIPEFVINLRQFYWHSIINLLKPVHKSHQTHCTSITNTDCLIPFGELVTVCCVTHTKHTDYTVWVECWEFEYRSVWYLHLPLWCQGLSSVATAISEFCLQ